ncbi:unnamed protein product [Gordionus sp. m RMFG-2023]|uniref:dehydrogenase/reductase SDR family member 11-like isoform X2 n=1 Tax=Gordionus sp. m RMFG-2023 TaxID=3053472 RepID=UPI0030E31147
MEKWKGKVALVTGASKGLGRCIAETLASHGIKVVACARNEEQLKSLSQELKQKNAHLDPVKCDMEDVTQILALFKYIFDNYGTLHICVNNAGVSFPDFFLPNEPIKDAKSLYGSEVKSRTDMYDRWLTTLRVNVLALSICCKEALNLMVATGSKNGIIINVSSIVGKQVILCPVGKEGPNDTYIHIYEATKFAVSTISQLIRLEIQSKHLEAHGIRILNLCPGWIKTNFADRILQVTSGNNQKDAPSNEIDFFKDIEHLDPRDVCDALMTAIACPYEVQIDEIILKAVKKSS